ncbi:uracil-DNA glycosylase family protein [Desulfopila aestuarii]|uniref:Uracil-DNA glycosylase-like domain-containing protein n=1 Tax=Desulfopila aestuarii DSM 18488 TaxID=1121416 RepID=A0A1M7YJR2_9BACT|nr:hypothetical protein [Desulfopila aestuarii]SHO52768.1 hypothetical protein SAMN02745220_04740 [Desulfopila aestuarii DSM 18488]
MCSTENFKSFVDKVRACDCTTCVLHRCISNSLKPIQLEHESPNDVNVLVITEQPKILNDQPVTNDNFLLVVAKSSTVKGLRDILGNDFLNSITSRSGKYYWTHHTRCPNEKRSPQNKCPENYLESELSNFVNLKLVISFGSQPFNAISKHIIKNGKNEKLIDYFYPLLIEQINSTKRHVYKLAINGRDVEYLALPHPSPANPLGLLLCKIKPLIESYLKQSTM